MIQSPILYYVSWYDLEVLKDTNLNYLYADTLAREQVLQQKVYPDRAYSITSDYKLWILAYSQFDTLESIKNESLLFSTHSGSAICNDDLCKITGINYYGLIEQYQKNICIVDLD